MNLSEINGISPYTYPGITEFKRINPVRYISRYFRKPIKSILKKDRTDEIKEIRQIAMWLAVTLEKMRTGKYSCGEVQKEFFPTYSREVIYHSWHFVSDGYLLYPEYKKKLENLTRHLYENHTIRVDLEKATEF